MRSGLTCTGWAVATRPFADVDRQALRWVKGRPRGLPRARMDADQREAFDHLVEAFLVRLKSEQVGYELDRIERADRDALQFVWAGAHAIEQPHYFRIEGPVTLIEFDNTEDNANHVHCVWRDPTNDFGDDVLAQQRAAQHGSPDPVEDYQGRTHCRSVLSPACL